MRRFGRGEKLPGAPEKTCGPGLLTNSIIFGGLFTTKVTTVKVRVSFYLLVGATPESVLVSLSGSNAKGEV